MAAENPLRQAYLQFVQGYQATLPLYDQTPSGLFQKLTISGGLGDRYMIAQNQIGSLSSHFDIKDRVITNVFQNCNILPYNDPSYVCRVIQESTTEGINTKFLFTSKKSEYEKALIVEHSITNGKVVNNVAIPIDSDDVIRLSARFPYFEHSHNRQTFAFIYEPTSCLWLLQRTEYPSTNKQVTTYAERKFSRDELRSVEIDCVPESVTVDGPLLSVRVATDDKIIECQIPASVPSSVSQNILEGKPMIPFSAKVTEKNAVQQ